MNDNKYHQVIICNIQDCVYRARNICMCDLVEIDLDYKCISYEKEE